jgi:signal transduction histidine kinase
VLRYRDGKVTHSAVPDILHDNPTHAICEDRAGTLWFGTHNGLIRYRDGVFTRYTKKDGLPGEVVYVLLEDHNGALWVGTERGLAIYRNGEFRSFNLGDGIPPYMVRSLYEDSSGVIWAGTYDAGLYRFRDGRFTAITARDGLFDNGVFQILDDGRGYFWISCNLGIYRVSTKELDDFAEGRIRKLTTIPYGKREGMLEQECNGGNQPAGIRVADGRLWFPTVKGVAVIDPARLEVNGQPPTVVIDEVAIDNKVAQVQDELRIEPGRENFAITYAGLSFLDPERIEFRYRLVGLDSDWIEAETRRTAYYSHVAPGTYIFEVLAANRDGVWSARPAQIRVVIVPPFWRTWWFFVLAFSLVSTLALLFYTRRVSALKRAHQIQEAFSRQLIESQEAERKRIAAELHDSLGQNLLVIKNRALLAMRTIGDGTIEQLHEIAATTDQAIDEVSEISYNLRPYHLDRLGLARAIEAMVGRASGSSGIKFSSAIDPVDNLFDPSAEISIYRIVQESVNNIIKHSGATEAQVTIKKNAREMEMQIRDDGRGIKGETGSNDSRPNGGFGLIGIAERARMLGGRYTLQSALGGGTTVTVQLNLPESKSDD